MDTTGKIKQILEEMQYRTDQKTPEELYNLALELFERTAAYRYGAKSTTAAADISSNTESAPVDPIPAASKEYGEPISEPTVHQSSRAESPSVPEPLQINKPAGVAGVAEVAEVVGVAEEKQTLHVHEPENQAKEASESESPEPPETLEISERPAATHQPEIAAPHEPETPKLRTDALPSEPIKKLKIGFNDRFAFINKLFHGEAEEYNQVIQAIERMSDLHQAENYLNMVVKPDFDWSEAEEFEERFRMCLEQHFA